MVVGAALIYVGGGSPVSYVGLAMMSHGADTLGGNVNTGGGASVDSSGNIDPFSYNPNDPGTTFGAGGNSGGGGIGGSSDDPTYYGHLTIYGYGDPYSSVNITDLFWKLGGVSGHWQRRYTGGVTLNSNGVPIGEVGIEAPNPFLDPVNYAGGLAGIGYKTGYEITLFKGLRVAPFGNRTPDQYGKWPHYHRSVPDPTKPGQSISGQGIGRHRPWETKSPDKSFWDRF
ncbi:MAG: hypothetical protein Q7T53_00465 [Deltaproteobacteria bacterium]|nr:hypothetical protein [Deltaproteobacteria bacterium]